MPDLPVAVDAVIALLVILPLAGVLSSMETALSSLSLARVESLVKDERSGAPRLLRVMNNRPTYINLLVLCAPASRCGGAGHRRGPDLIGDKGWAATAPIVLVSLLIYVAVGVVSRTMGRRNPYTLSMRASWFLVAVTRVLGPAGQGAGVVRWTVHPGRALRDGPFASEIELREMVDIASERGVVEVDERRMIQSVFDLASTTAREVMVPRPEMLDRADKRQPGRAPVALRSVPRSRGRESVDDGSAWPTSRTCRRDLRLRCHLQPRTTPVSERDAEAVFVPDSRMLDDCWRHAARPDPIAVLVDEYGGTRRTGEHRGHPRGDRRRDLRRVRPGGRRPGDTSTRAATVDSWLSLGDLVEVTRRTGLTWSSRRRSPMRWRPSPAWCPSNSAGAPPGCEVDVAGLHLTCEGGRSSWSGEDPLHRGGRADPGAGRSGRSGQPGPSRRP